MKVEITNPDKLIYPDQKIKKIDVIKYYADVSDKMLPFIKNRPLATIRCHDGIKGECFFKKHPANDKFVERFNNKGEEYFYVKDCAQLIYQAQMGTIEFHTWACTIKKLENPNCMVFDLDPDDKLPRKKLINAVKLFKTVLDGIELISFLKTSGGKGYHVVVPFTSSNGWEGFYEFSKKVSVLAEKNYPDIFTTNIRKIERKGKIFIDYLRNNRGSTCVAPYSLRARDGASVSMPITWSDIEKIKPNQITLKNYKKHLNDSWKDFFLVKQKLK